MGVNVAEIDRELAGALRKRGQRVTPQRLVIHRVLRRGDRHFTAEGLLEAVEAELPNVALPTIYGTLELFEELGVVRRVAVFRGGVLYDTRRAPHQHAICRLCGRAQDVEVTIDEAPAVAAAEAAGFAAERAELTVYGICADCRRRA